MGRELRLWSETLLKTVGRVGEEDEEFRRVMRMSKGNDIVERVERATVIIV